MLNPKRKPGRPSSKTSSTNKEPANIGGRRYAYLVDNYTSDGIRWWPQISVNGKWIDDPSWNGQFDIITKTEFEQRSRAAGDLNIQVYDYEIDFYNAT